MDNSLHHLATVVKFTSCQHIGENEIVLKSIVSNVP